MSVLLPVLSPDRGLVELLLREQQSLTAVEQFSRVHDTDIADAAGAPAQQRYYRRLMPMTEPAPHQQLAFEVDLDACSGCKACVVACHTLNGLEDQESWRRVGTLVGENILQHVTTACHHCEDPGCLKGCPVKAYVKDEATGVVRHLDDQCIGCKYCTMMCPYEVPQYSEQLGIVRKCDMCHQRLSVGEAPACVQACPNEAIRIQVVDRQLGQLPASQSSPADPITEVSIGKRLAPGAPDSSITFPTTRYLSRRPASLLASTPQDAAVDRVSESHWPLAVLLVATQAAVGLVVLERLAATVCWITGGAPVPELSLASATIAITLTAVGLNVAPLHLGQPLKSWRVFLGLRTSWLSREAVLLGAFTGILGAAAALLWLPRISEAGADAVFACLPSWAANVLLAAAIPVGLAAFVSSAMVYVATRRVMWRGTRTMTRFGGTAAFLGLVALVFSASIATSPPGWLATATVAAVLVLMMKLTYETATHYSATAVANTLSGHDARSARLVWGPLRGWLALRVVTAIAAGLLLCAATVVAVTDRAAISGTSPVPPTSPEVLLLGSALLLAIVGEFTERLLYFASVVHDRMPGTLR